VRMVTGTNAPMDVAKDVTTTCGPWLPGAPIAQACAQNRRVRDRACDLWKGANLEAVKARALQLVNSPGLKGKSWEHLKRAAAWRLWKIIAS
jgi:hypothetical protein